MKQTWKTLVFSAAATLINAALLIAIVIGWATANGIVVWR